jgi:hypothetical protein
MEHTRSAATLSSIVMSLILAIQPYNNYEPYY